MLELLHVAAGAHDAVGERGLAGSQVAEYDERLRLFASRCRVVGCCCITSCKQQQ